MVPTPAFAGHSELHGFLEHHREWFLPPAPPGSDGVSSSRALHLRGPREKSKALHLWPTQGRDPEPIPSVSPSAPAPPQGPPESADLSPPGLLPPTSSLRLGRLGPGEDSDLPKVTLQVRDQEALTSQILAHFSTLGLPRASCVSNLDYLVLTELADTSQPRRGSSLPSPQELPASGGRKCSPPPGCPPRPGCSPPPPCLMRDCEALKGRECFWNIPFFLFKKS